MFSSIVLAVLLLVPLSSGSDLSSTIFPEIASNILEITKSNFNTTLQSYDVVFINFYADWCHFSTRLAPIFQEAAYRLDESLSKENKAKVRLGRVDCVKETELSRFCSINKFPTLKLYNRGHPCRREYRGKRSVEALVEYVLKEFQTSIKLFNDIEQLDILDMRRRCVIAFFENRKNSEFKLFELLAERFKNDCDFYLRVGGKKQNMAYTQSMPTIVYRPDKVHSHASDEIYSGNLAHQTELEAWLLKNCVPLVKEVNFNNIEEIIEQRLPLLVLFHLPNDVISVKDFKSIVEVELSACPECGKYNFVTVDGLRFEHSVLHMGKTKRDLPIIAIDSLKHMFSYPNFMDMYIPGHLKTFLKDFNSHNLHHKLKMKSASEKQAQHQPPLSTFKELGPSRHRYTLVVHDEL